MKILFISMPSIHSVRWIENLKEVGHELYWFDVLGKGKLPTEISINQIINWKKRKLPYLKGEYFLRRKFSVFYTTLQPFLEVTANEKLAQILNEIQPDLVHSFEMQSCSYPILKTMQKYPQIKWLYSCWGSDLFYYQNQSQHVSKIKSVLSSIQYLHTDCNRDFLIAQSLGFKGKHLGVIPGGGGFHLEQFLPYSEPLSERKIILIKGYHHHVGRGMVLVKAVRSIQESIEKFGFKVVVFGAHQEVIDYVITNQLSYKVYDRHGLTHQELLQLMGKSALYLGNSISDGMPNTLLEAIIMGAFPIQSNPGKVTAEIITEGENGFLIENPNDDIAISNVILDVLQQPELLQKAFEVNQKIARERLDYSVNRQKIIALYQQIENDTCE
jgi:glycosyltransferase involved in cell wall biosynthesis